MQTETISNDQAGKLAGQITYNNAKVPHKRDERSAVDNRDLVQKYKEGKVQILLEFSTGFVDEKYIIVFQGKAKVSNGEYPRIRFSRFWKHLGIKAPDP